MLEQQAHHIWADEQCSNFKCGVEIAAEVGVGICAVRKQIFYVREFVFTDSAAGKRRTGEP
jgi:hypothetical protein